MPRARTFVLCTTLFSTTLLSTLAPAHAGETGAPLAAPSRPPDVIAVYGFRDRDADEVGGAVAVISAESIEAEQYVFVADALRAAPGVSIAQNGVYGGFASARLRGGSSGQTLVVVDGIVVNDPSAPQGGFNFANLDVADVERIDILRGPQSLVWGADAVGGVIAVTSKSDGPPVSAFLEGGARQTLRGSAAFGVRADDIFARARVTGITSEGLSRAAAGTEKDGYEAIGGSLTIGADLGASTALRLNARIGSARAEIDGFPPPFFALGDTEEVEKTMDYAIGASLVHGAGAPFDGRLFLAASGIDRYTEDQGARTFAARGNRFTAGYSGAVDLSNALSVEAGAEGELTSADVSGVDETARTGAVFALLDWRPNGRVQLSAGARRDEFSNFEGATTARVSGVFSLLGGPRTAAERRLLLRASWGEGFRAPSLFELNFDQFGVTPNPLLAPERAAGVDLGLEWRSGARDQTLLRATLFRQRVKDQIDFDLARNGYYNIDRVKSEGVELEAQIPIGSRIAAGFSYSFIDARDAATGAPILRTPKHAGNATLSFAPTERLDLSTSLFFNGREADFPTANDAFVKLDLRASFSLNNALDLYGRIENATNTDYEDVSGYAEPRRAAFVGARARL
jgi:vitamin B12 transporter